MPILQESESINISMDNVDSMKTDIDWNEVKQDLKKAPFQPDDEGRFYRTTFLGTVFSIMPSGKYWTYWACGNVTDEEMEKDAEYWEALETEAEKHGLFVLSGEGDPCDILIGECQKCPMCGCGVYQPKDATDLDNVDLVIICENPDCDWYDTLDAPPL